MKGLDLRRLKKISSDDKTTTFRHDMGHEIKIVHSMLSPKMLKELENIHAQYAEGGNVQSNKQRVSNEKGVHQGDEEGSSKKAAGMSMAGVFARNAEDPRSKKMSVEEHQKVLSQIQSMPKPDLYAKGGETGVNKETTKKGVSEAGTKLNPAFSVFGKESDTENAKNQHKKTLEELKSMPKPQLYADGSGDVQSDPAPNYSPDDSSQQQAPAATPQGPVVINVNGGQPATQAPGPTPTPSPQPQQSQPSDQSTVPVSSNPPAQTQPGPTDPNAQNPAQPPDNSADAEAAAPAVPVKPVAPLPPPTAGQVLTQPMSADDALNHLNDQTAKLRQDFNNGQITPKTYSDLFANKSTLGKIGTIFGLMVGGAGAGLAHQQNALLGMMDKEIDRDLDAQKQTKANQFNALNLAETHYRNEVASQFTQQQGKQAEANTALANANLPLVKANAAKTSMELAVEQQALRNAGMLPANTPMGQKAQATAGAISNAITAQQAQRNQQVAQQIEANGQQVQQQSANEPYNESYGMRTYPVLAPDAMQKSIGSTYLPFINQPKLQSQLTKADQVSKVLNGPTGNGEGGIHELLQNMYQDIDKGSQTGSLEQRIKGAIGHIPYVGDIGEKGANAIFSGTGYKDYASKRTGMIQDLSTALSGLVAPTDIIKLVDDNLPIHGDEPEDVDNKERQIYNGIMKAMPTDELQKAGLLARKR